MKLKIRYRSADNTSTNNNNSSSTEPVLFARLPLRVVKILYEEAKKNASINKASESSSISCWNIEDSSSSSMEFLPLQFTRAHTTKNKTNTNNNSSLQICYTSFNGGILLDEEKDVIELHSGSQTWEENEEVDVIALSTVRNATRIRIDPLQLEDWELLECFAMSLEDGGLLSQISIVYPNQRLPLTLSSSTTAHVRITSNYFEKEPCLRLVPETIVEIVPHPRSNSHKSTSTEWSVPFRVAPYCSDVDDFTQQRIQDLMSFSQSNKIIHSSCSIWLQNFKHQQQQLASVMTNYSSELLLVSLWIHPTTLLPYMDKFQTNTKKSEFYRAQIRTYQSDNNDTDDSNNLIAIVFMDTTIPLNHVGMFISHDIKVFGVVLLEIYFLLQELTTIFCF